MFMETWCVLAEPAFRNRAYKFMPLAPISCPSPSLLPFSCDTHGWLLFAASAKRNGARWSSERPRAGMWLLVKCEAPRFSHGSFLEGMERFLVELLLGFVVPPAHLARETPPHHGRRNLRRQKLSLSRRLKREIQLTLNDHCCYTCNRPCNELKFTFYQNGLMRCIWFTSMIVPCWIDLTRRQRLSCILAGVLLCTSWQFNLGQTAYLSSW